MLSSFLSSPATPQFIIHCCSASEANAASTLCIRAFFPSPRPHGCVLRPAGPIHGPAHSECMHDMSTHLSHDSRINGTVFGSRARLQFPCCARDNPHFRRGLEADVSRRCSPRHLSSLFQQQDAHAEPPNNRSLNDRKRKFVDAELSQDSEGNAILNVHFNVKCMG